MLLVKQGHVVVTVARPSLDNQLALSRAPLLLTVVLSPFRCWVMYTTTSRLVLLDAAPLVIDLAMIREKSGMAAFRDKVVRHSPRYPARQQVPQRLDALGRRLSATVKGTLSVQGETGRCMHCLGVRPGNVRGRVGFRNYERQAWR